MRYSAPELIALGPATALVLGGDLGENDRGTSIHSKPMMGLALGLD